MLQKMPAISTNLVGSRRPSLGPSAPCFESPGAGDTEPSHSGLRRDQRSKARQYHVFVDAGPGTPDGLRSDVDGTLWCGWGMGTAELDGVFIYSPEGKLIGRIHLPERCANLCFGGAKHNRLFMAASKSLYSLYVNTQGAAGGEAGTMLSPRQVSLTPPRTEDPRERTRFPVCLLRDCRRRHRRLCASIRS
jgi:hypothetical protein